MSQTQSLNPFIDGIATKPVRTDSVNEEQSQRVQWLTSNPGAWLEKERNPIRSTSAKFARLLGGFPSHTESVSILSNFAWRTCESPK
ncbi:hypothetical protein OXX69_003050 [Metschnikowia pulcherrima]